MSVLTFIRIREVMKRTGMSKTLIYNLIGKGDFPRPVQLGKWKASAWPEHEVVAWMQKRMDARKTPHRQGLSGANCLLPKRAPPRP